MSRFNTGNPIDSNDPRDLSDNARNLDQAVNTEGPNWTDRLGNSRQSWAGMESEFQADQGERKQRFDTFIASSGYQFVGDYDTGIELTEYNQVVRDTGGEFWRVSGSQSLPYTTTGAGLPEGGAFVTVGDAALRQELDGDVANGQGARLVRGAVIYVDTVADLQALDTSGLVEGQAASVQGSEFRWGGSVWLPTGAVSVRAFGAKGDGVTDDWDAFQSAIDFVLPFNGTVVVPASEDWYFISSTLTLKATVKLIGESGSSGQRGTNPAGDKVSGVCSTLFQSDVSQPLIDMRGRSVVSGIRIQCNNENLLSPEVSPPCILTDNAGYCQIQDIRFEYPYIAVGNTPGNNTGTCFIDGLWGFVHHRMVYLSGTKDIAWIKNLHSQNPDGISWEEDWYSWNNKVLVEVEDVDGAVCDSWYTYGGKSVFKHSGAGNLNFDLVNIKAEAVSHGIDISGQSTNNNAITFTNGYIQTNNREDAEYVVGLKGDCILVLQGMSIAQSENVPHLFVEDGFLLVTGGVFRGSVGADLLKKTGGHVSIDNSHIRAYRTLLDIDDDPSQVYLGPSNSFFNQDIGELYDFERNQIALSDITAPPSLTGGDLVRYISESNLHTKTKGVVSFHEGRLSDAEGMSLDLTLANNGGAWVTGGKARLQAFNRGRSPGNEMASLKLKPYISGDFTDGVEVRENGQFNPESDASQQLGNANFRWSELFASNGTINTSDEREKQKATSLSEAEVAAAIEIKGMIQKFKWNHAVEAKGDSARWHFGVMAQEVSDVFEEHGLDAHDYGLFCYDQWDEELDDEGRVLVKKGDRYGVRYDQLLAFIISAM